MGAWGNRIMESDLASDIRGVFCRQIEVGGTVSKAVNKVYEELGHSEHDPDFFLALAWVIASMGAVPIDIRERALRIIADSGSLERWRDSGFFRERQKEEQRLRQILEGTVPHPEPYKKATVARIKVGDVLEIPLTSGKRAYAQYLCADPKHGSLIQVFALTGDQVPELRDIIDSGPLFPPIFSDVKVAAKHWGWRIVGHSAVKDLIFPLFRQGGRGGWWLYVGKTSTHVPALPPGGEQYEILICWGHDALVRRIETRANPFSR